MYESPFRAHAHQLLAGSHVRVFPNIDGPRFRRAIAGMGGLDHLSADAPIAFADDTPDFECSVILTEQRLIARGSGGVVEIRHADLLGAQTNDPSRADRLYVAAHGQMHEIHPCRSAAPIAAFLYCVAQLPPADRAPPPRDLAPRTGADPTGALAARAAVQSGDPRVLPIMGMAHEGFAQGKGPAQMAADFVTRAALLDRTLVFGRGMRQGWWLSPLAGPDLVYAFTRMLGAPRDVAQDGETFVYDFTLRSGGSAGGAVASSAVGLASLAILGVGWVSTPGTVSVPIRLRVLPRDTGCGFSLYEGPAPLSVSSADLVSRLFEGLPRIEARLLLERATYGWQLPPEQLDDLPIEDLAARVFATIGPVDLKCYFPPAQR